MRWWTSDTHFGHESILGFGRERWATIDEHDRDLVDNWNDVVGADDEVWHLGDVAWSFDRLVEVLPTLKGRITLVAGNHDSWWLKRPGFDGVIDYPEGSSDYGSTSQVPG